MTITIDMAISILKDIRHESPLGGETCIVLSLADSGLPDVDIDNIFLIAEENNGSAYVEIAVRHPDLVEKP